MTDNNTENTIKENTIKENNVQENVNKVEEIVKGDNDNEEMIEIILEKLKTMDPFYLKYLSSLNPRNIADIIKNGMVESKVKILRAIDELNSKLLIINSTKINIYIGNSYHREYSYGDHYYTYMLDEPTTLDLSSHAVVKNLAPNHDLRGDLYSYNGKEFDDNINMINEFANQNTNYNFVLIITTKKDVTIMHIEWIESFKDKYKDIKIEYTRIFPPNKKVDKLVKNIFLLSPDTVSKLNAIKKLECCEKSELEAIIEYLRPK